MKKKVLIFIVSLLLILVGFFLYPSYKTAELKEADSQYLTEMENPDADIETPATTDNELIEDLATDETATEEPNIDNQDKVIVIDAGHQQKGDLSKEPIGPGASEQKAKVTYGNVGVKTGTPEYQLNLEIALKLQTELEARGYTVIMCRTDNDVNMSNSERAAIANEANADAFIRIHCNGYDSSSVHGAMTMCQTENNPYNGNRYEESRLLSECVLDYLVDETGCKKQNIFEDDSMSGINWSMVPVTIVEVGYLSNPDEEAKLVTDDYQQKVAVGIANGVDAYIAAREANTDIEEELK
ncbi:N-acetylmuramoyl-L-alanine amidase family protein [Pseudobutyrivibrio sp.]|uniref:N-acetylmuramoyl-L-alanine amidase family protein n=1 Tax=Pseudobutyrivibrio sp. TaxID=2014367 RepID=UPI0025DF46ED|nr:N-acetylmuramoyl-L-alanine amidase [Pseudobutyrivibrio sp.]MBR5648775.1 N-acetylmuramoyl-L-alanine amidase [Pseudobutyrivibrio sp.]